MYNVRVADHHTYFVGTDEWGFSVWAHNACLIIYRYAQGQYPPEMRHWSVGITTDKESLYADLKNDTAGQPTDNDAKKLQN